MEQEDTEVLKVQTAVIVKACTQPAGCLALLPLLVAEHWTLLAVDQQQRQCRYYDSLPVQSEKSWLVADFVLEQLKNSDVEAAQWLPSKVPDRRNEAYQGPLHCGFYICHWMEEDCRHMLGQGGLPSWLPQSCAGTKDAGALHGEPEASSRTGADRNCRALPGPRRSGL